MSEAEGSLALIDRERHDLNRPGSPTGILNRSRQTGLSPSVFGSSANGKLRTSKLHLYVGRSRWTSQAT